MNTRSGFFLEDFDVGRVFRHATPRTITAGDRALHVALTGSRFAMASADTFAAACGFVRAPVDDVLVFNMIFGKTVPDISANAIANLGYASGRFTAPVHEGDTLDAVSEVIGRRELSNGRSGIVWVRSTGRNQDGRTVLDYVRWVMVNKRDPASPAPEAIVPALADAVDPASIVIPQGLDLSGYDWVAAGHGTDWESLERGQRFDHVDGMTIEEGEHQMATRLYQNTARVHFDQHRSSATRFGRRIVYGGHIISLARALSFNGLCHACLVAALNGGRHTAPTFAGDTIYAWSEVLEKAEVEGRQDVGLARVRTVAAKNHACDDFPDRGDDGRDHPDKVLDLDYWVVMPRR